MLATEAAHELVVKALIRYGANVNARTMRNGTALHYAMIDGNHMIINDLITNGADLDACDCSGKTPMIWAARHQNANAIRILIARGATTCIDDEEDLSFIS